MKRLTVAKIDPHLKFRIKVTAEALSNFLEKELSQYKATVSIMSVRNDNRILELDLEGVPLPFKFIIEGYKTEDIVIRPNGGNFDLLKKKHGSKLIWGKFQKPNQIKAEIEESYKGFVKNVENSYEDLRMN